MMMFQATRRSKGYHHTMKKHTLNYISTRGNTSPRTFSEAVLTGLAPDGGLLLPETVPDVSADLVRWRNLSYGELASAILRRFTDLPTADLDEILRASLQHFSHPEITPLRSFDKLHILELFHGPTLAFKDLALQFLGNLFAYLLDGGRELNLLAATSGDTGSAAIAGVRGKPGIRIFVLYPAGRISALQERQMTTVPDDNVAAIAIDGSFDDCQAIVKELFSDAEFKQRYALGAVNSINWARVLAQIVYYFHGAFRVMERTGAERVRFSVPTGNFGDIFAGYMAWRMGLPVSRLILATNANDILARFFVSGDYSLCKVRATLSPSMDIQVASNFERYLFYRAGGAATTVRQWMQTFSDTGRLCLHADDGRHIDPLFSAESADDAAIIKAIADTYENTGYILDPHSAAGVHAAAREGLDGDPVVCIATAHAAKFPDAVRQAIGRTAVHENLEQLKRLPTREHRLPNDADAVRDFMERRIE